MPPSKLIEVLWRSRDPSINILINRGGGPLCGTLWGGWHFFLNRLLSQRCTSSDRLQHETNLLSNSGYSTRSSRCRWRMAPRAPRFRSGRKARLSLVSTSTQMLPQRTVSATTCQHTFIEVSNAHKEKCCAPKARRSVTFRFLVALLRTDWSQRRNFNDMLS